MTEENKRGPLQGIRIVELAGLGPAPYCGMLLSDLGADVVTIERPGGATANYGFAPDQNIFNRGRRIVVLDLKKSEDAAKALDLIAHADGLIEGNRPGVTERLGIGPGACLARNPRLVYGRMTGWGQTGRLAHYPGHDINYIAVSGALHTVGNPGEKPTVPQNFVGDMGGGGMLLAFGMVSAILEAMRSGKGQVVDAAMVDGAASQLTGLLLNYAIGQFTDERGKNLCDGEAPFYGTYETADGKYIAVGAIEPAFYRAFRKGLGLLDNPDFDKQHDNRLWSEQRRRIADIIRTRSRDAWVDHFDPDACVSPVLAFAELEQHPIHKERGTFVTDGKTLQPSPVPRFSRTPGGISSPPSNAKVDLAAVLAEWQG